MYNTLQDFTAHVKGTSYLLTGLILVVVVVFWIYLNKKVTRK